MPSFKYLQSVLRNVLNQCVFEYAGFSVSAHDRARFAAVLGDLVKKGKLTKNSNHERNWVGTSVVRRLAQAMLEEALLHGPICWDIEFSKVLSMVLVSALVARAGDVLRSAWYEDTVCLCYKDVSIKVVETSDGPSLAALITMTCNKDEK